MKAHTVILQANPNRDSRNPAITGPASAPSELEEAIRPEIIPYTLVSIVYPSILSKEKGNIIILLL